MPVIDTPPPTPGTGTPPKKLPSSRADYPGYGQLTDLGANWRIKFADADGIPLNMLSFEVIDFGAIAYKEIFQNVKTILATPLYSAALERLLGIDQTIVDLPIDQAAQATVAILDALYFWEPRVEVINISFNGDVIAGHLICSLQLKVKNVIYATEQPYDRNNIFDTPSKVSQNLPPIEIVEGPEGPQGPPGQTGQRGSLWFTGTTSPAAQTRLPTIKIPIQGPQGAPGKPGERGFIWLSGSGDPITPQDKDMYLNAVNGDVWQFDEATQTWLRTGKQ